METAKINRQQKDQILERLGFDKDKVRCHYCKEKIEDNLCGIFPPINSHTIIILCNSPMCIIEYLEEYEKNEERIQLGKKRFKDSLRLEMESLKAVDIVAEKMLLAKMKNSVPIDSFSVEGKQIKMKAPIKFMVKFKEKKYHLTNEKLELYITADTIEYAILDAQDQLGLLWTVYVDCTEKELTDGAMELRKLLIKITGHESKKKIEDNHIKNPKWEKISENGWIYRRRKMRSSV